MVTSGPWLSASEDVCSGTPAQPALGEPTGRDTVPRSEPHRGQATTRTRGRRQGRGRWIRPPRQAGLVGCRGCLKALQSGLLRLERGWSPRTCPLSGGRDHRAWLGALRRWISLLARGAPLPDNRSRGCLLLQQGAKVGLPNTEERFPSRGPDPYCPPGVTGVAHPWGKEHPHLLVL